MFTFDDCINERKKMKKLAFLNIFLAICIGCFAGTVDTVTIYSQSMKRNIKCVVIKPDAYVNNERVFPTVYLLHGHSGNYRNWITKVPQLKRYVDKYNLIIVTPHGDFSS
jgi:S-formylglutathione hydrolase FrmB